MGAVKGFTNEEAGSDPVKSGTRVLVSCSNRLLTEAIARILSKKSEFNVTSSNIAFLDDAGVTVSQETDVMVLDSLESFASWRSPGAAPDGKPNCVLVAMEDNHVHFLRAVQSGIRGYVLRDASAVEVISAIRSVAQGQAACPASYTRILFDYVSATPQRPVVGAPGASWELTRREQQIVPLISQGLTNKEIANVLNLSEQTVKNHIHRMMRKMQSSSRLDVCNTWFRQACSAAGTFMGYGQSQNPA